MLGEGQGTQRCRGFRVSTGTIPLSKTEEQSEIEREREGKKGPRVEEAVFRFG